jgi:hypothetical protein
MEGRNQLNEKLCRPDMQGKIQAKNPNSTQIKSGLFDRLPGFFWLAEP